MALGDGIRRNVANISQAERDLLIDAFLNLDTTKFYPDGVSYWDKQEDIHKEAHAAGQDVHSGPAFIPWHRELCNRLEALLREVHPEVSLHYWDWTTDPRASNLFSPQFMGSALGNAGPPLQNFESTEPGHSVIWRNVNGGFPGVPAVNPDNTTVTSGDGGPQDNQFPSFLAALQNDHNTAHGYIGGTLGFQHFSFHDPFVFLLHSNMDRLWAMWQMAAGKGWRLDPNQVYGTDGSSGSINDALQPWAGTSPPLLRPWAPPDNQQLVKTSKDLTVVLPPAYDTQNTDWRTDWLYSLYADLLGRAPDTGGLAYWVSELTSGVSLDNVANGFLDSQEYSTSIITGLYDQLLNRAPDAGGLASWTSNLEKGTALQQIILGFCDSTEYKNNNPPPTQFVDSLYRRLLGRAPDAGGEQYWVNALQAGRSTAYVINGFLTSQEYCTDKITNLYLTLLGRQPDANGLAFWVKLMTGGTSFQQIQRGFLTSAEYLGRALARFPFRLSAGK